MQDRTQRFAKGGELKFEGVAVAASHYRPLAVSEEMPSSLPKTDVQFHGEQRTGAAGRHGAQGPFVWPRDADGGENDSRMHGGS